jgi:hypothetical protein
MINYEATIQSTIENAAKESQEIYNEVQNAAENGSTDYHNGKGTGLAEDAESLNYIEGYLDSINRSDILVIINL